MNLQQRKNREDMKVWLSQNEVEDFLGAAADTQQRIAFALGARCGLRSHEVLDVAPEDVVDTDAGTMLRVCHGKGDKFRETSVPRNLATTIDTIDYRDAGASSPLVEITSTRSLRRWVRSAADELYEETSDAGWDHCAHEIRLAVYMFDAFATRVPILLETRGRLPQPAVKISRSMKRNN
ncbi:site-specific integrase [Natrinema sp. SYSU A 869]|uniref:site-specific integrase n=1 Tax=Natrinema sp. SYSU A 869 TaxID=2871694 RepID=UPI002104FA19|nr:site-specific integrase [Natrinema sp. SYSU A 869]